MTTEKREDIEDEAFAPEEISAIGETGNILRKGFPWLSATPEQARDVAARAGFPRSISGKYQSDTLARMIFYTKQGCRDANLVPLAITKVVSAIAFPDPAQISRDSETFSPLPGSILHQVAELGDLVTELARRLNPGEPFRPKTISEFFGTVAERLRYFENFKPTAGDFAIEELQNAFVGLMQSKYNWGKSGTPTKGEVTEMAKAFLEKSHQKTWKSTWTELLKTAGLDWLKPGKAGRPPKNEVDQIAKSKKAFLSGLTKYINEVSGGDWIAVHDKAKHVFGGKKLYQQDEQVHLKKANNFYGNDDVTE